MCTFPESQKMALSLGAVRKHEETGRADPKRQESGVSPFMAYLRQNTGNHLNGEK